MSLTPVIGWRTWRVHRDMQCPGSRLHKHIRAVQRKGDRPRLCHRRQRRLCAQVRPPCLTHGAFVQETLQGMEKPDGS